MSADDLDAAIARLADQLERAIIHGDTQLDPALTNPNLQRLTGLMNAVLDAAPAPALDEAVRSRTAELMQARVIAEGASDAKSSFLSLMSHELRTPLNSIIGFAQLLLENKKEPLSARQQRQAAHVLNGGRHLLELINDVLDLSKIETGNLQITPESVDVRDVIVDSLKIIDPLIEKHDVRFENRIVPAAEVPLVWCDFLRAKQCLINLLNNAFKYNRPGGVVWIDTKTFDDGRVRILVGDNGLGIAAEKHHEIFRPFSRLGHEKSGIDGSGIGLTLTRALIHAMDGALDFESAEGTGSVFWFDLPVSKAPAAEPPPKPKHPQALTAKRARGRVLYIEENPANTVLMQDILDDYTDTDAVFAASAEDGIEIALSDALDIIVLDITLPGMSGIDAVRYLRETPKTAKIPIFALSADARDETRRRCIAAGIDRFFAKPVEVIAFINALNEILPCGQETQKPTQKEEGLPT